MAIFNTEGNVTPRSSIRIFFQTGSYKPAANNCNVHLNFLLQSSFIFRLYEKNKKGNLHHGVQIHTSNFIVYILDTYL